MTELYADCPVHGIFKSESFIDVGDGVTLRISGSRIPCPVCRRQSEVIEGEYDFSFPPKPKVTLNPTPAQLSRLQTALTWAQQAISDDQADEEEVQRKIRRAAEKEAPQVVALVDRVFGTKGAGVAAWVAVMLTIIELLMGSSAPEITPEFIEQIVEQVQKDGENEQPTTPSPAVPKAPQKRHNPEEPVIVKT